MTIPITPVFVQCTLILERPIRCCHSHSQREAVKATGANLCSRGKKSMRVKCFCLLKIVGTCPKLDSFPVSADTSLVTTPEVGLKLSGAGWRCRGQSEAGQQQQSQQKELGGVGEKLGVRLAGGNQR